MKKLTFDLNALYVQSFNTGAGVQPADLMDTDPGHCRPSARPTECGGCMGTVEAHDSSPTRRETACAHCACASEGCYATGGVPTDCADGAKL